MRSFLLLLFLCAMLLTSAQKLQGVWEGSLFVQGEKKNTMRVRIEMLKDGNTCLGVLYSRGIDKNIIYGCDYLIIGTVTKNTCTLRRKKIQRSVALNKTDCFSFDKLTLIVNENEQANTMHGRWVWENESEDLFSCKKVSDTISDMAKDEIESYLTGLYDEYRITGVRLPAGQRQMKKEAEITVDMNDVVVELSSIDSSEHDSISVYLNGDCISPVKSIITKPLRLRIKELPVGVNHLVVVSESVMQQKLTLKMKIIHAGQINFLTLMPGYIENSFIQLNRIE